MSEDLSEIDWRKVPKITQDSYTLLLKISKWTKFLAIVGIVLLVLGVLGIIGLGVIMDGTNQYMYGHQYYPYHGGQFSWAYAVVACIILIVLCIPVFFLLTFSTRLKKALHENETNMLTEAFNSLHKYYLLSGIYTIVILALYIVGIVLMVVGMSAY